MARVGVLPGSFDPYTTGHYGIIENARHLFDTLYVGVLNNPDKKYLFSVDERLEMLSGSLKFFDNVEIVQFNGLLVELCNQVNAQFIVRGIRDVTDFSYEMNLFQTNSRIDPYISTIFVPAPLHASGISSSAARTVAQFSGKNLESFVNPTVAQMLREKYGYGSETK